MSEEKQPDFRPEPYLSDDVTVGQLVRFVNHTHWEAARNKDNDVMNECQRQINKITAALKEYRLSKNE